MLFFLQFFLHILVFCRNHQIWRRGLYKTWMSKLLKFIRHVLIYLLSFWLMYRKNILVSKLHWVEWKYTATSNTMQLFPFYSGTHALWHFSSFGVFLMISIKVSPEIFLNGKCFSVLQESFFNWISKKKVSEKLINFFHQLILRYLIKKSRTKKIHLLSP